MDAAAQLGAVKSVSVGAGTSWQLLGSELVSVTQGSTCSTSSIPAWGGGRRGRLSSSKEDCRSPKSSSAVWGRISVPSWEFSMAGAALVVWSRAWKKDPTVKLSKNTPCGSASQCCLSAVILLFKSFVTLVCLKGRNDILEAGGVCRQVKFNTVQA